MNIKDKKIRRRMYGTILAVGLAFGMPGVAAAEEAALEAQPAETPVTQIDVTAKAEDREGSAESGYRHETASIGPLGQKSLQDIPYSIQVTSGELIENRGAHTMSDALQTNPSIAIFQHQRSWAFTPGLIIRGFQLQSYEPSYLLDGLPLYVSVPPSVEDVERIEVLNGTSGFLYGFGNVGGTINFVGKKPTTEKLTAVTLGQYGGGVNYLHADLGGPLADDERLTFRLNAYKEDGDTYLDGKQERTLISGAINYQLTPDTLLKADFSHQDTYGEGAQATFTVAANAGFKVPDADNFDSSKQYGQPWTYNKSRRNMFGLGLEKKINDTFQLRTAFRKLDSRREWSGIMANLLNSNGDYTQKYVQVTPQDFSAKTGYLFMDAKFDTGKVKHDLTFGYSKTDYVQEFAPSSPVNLARREVLLPGTFNIYSAPAYVPRPILSDQDNPVHTNYVYQSLMLGDQIKFDDAWSMLAGINSARISTNVTNQDTGVTSSDYSQSKITPSIALLYKPGKNVTTYVSYMENLTAGGTAPVTAANAGQVLPPSVNEQYEAGIKANLGNVDLTAAVFKIDKSNAFTDPDDMVYKQDGRQVHKGLEVTATGKLDDNLRLVSGVTFLDPEITRARTRNLEGKNPENVPKRQIRTYLEYDLPGVTGLTLSAGASYYGKRPIDALNTADMPSATVFDAGLRYLTQINGNKTTFTLNVTNLFDKEYWVSYTANGGYVLSDPRMVSLSAKVEF